MLNIILTISVILSIQFTGINHIDSIVQLWPLSISKTCSSSQVDYVFVKNKSHPPPSSPGTHCCIFCLCDYSRDLISEELYNICCFVSDLCHLASCPQGPST